MLRKYSPGIGRLYILKAAGNREPLLNKIRNYFLEKRRDGHWRNTYESSLILETILPDLLADEATFKSVSLSIISNDTLNVRQFPFHTEIKNGADVTVHKAGAMPVYFTAYEQHWNPAPGKLEGNFLVSTDFLERGHPISILKAGTAVIMQTKVIVKADAGYVMIEIPIPAGCSYSEKTQGQINGEVHREYFKDKVSIFCSSLARGDYEFSVSLLPRYTGRYILNPAKAEMMYFPVFNGREALKKVNIK